jgi:nucleoside-diphosphate-sugar epimerase
MVTQIQRDRKPTALVIGATGSAGHHIVRELQARGFKVSGTCRDPKRAEGLRDVHLHALDLLNYKSIQEFARNVPKHDVMIDNAGALTVRHPDEYRANDEGKRRLYMDLMVYDHLPQTVTHVSSSMAALAEELIRNGYDRHTGNILGGYTLSKYDGENYPQETFQQKFKSLDGLIIVRPAMLAGPGDYGTEAMASALQMGIYPTFVPMGDSLREGARWFLNLIGQADLVTPAEAPRVSLMAVEDFARELVTMTAANLDRPRFGIYTMANRNEPILPSDQIEAGKTALHKKRIYNPWLPRIIFALLLWIEEKGNALKGKASSSRAERWRELTVRNLNVDRHKLEADFPELAGDSLRSQAEILAAVAQTREQSKLAKP